MTIQEFLAEDGLTEEQIAAIVGDPVQSKLMTRALARFEEGNTSLTAAQREKAEAAEFWETKVTPALASVDKRVATSSAEAARYKAYLQSLKDGGYDVPDELLKAAPVVETPKYMTQADLDAVGKNTGPSLIAINQVSNEYQDLYGAPYLSGEADFAEAQKQHKPWTSYVREKYAFQTKREERSAKQASREGSGDPQGRAREGCGGASQTRRLERWAARPGAVEVRPAREAGRFQVRFMEEPRRTGSQPCRPSQAF